MGVPGSYFLGYFSCSWTSSISLRLKGRGVCNRGSLSPRAPGSYFWVYLCFVNLGSAQDYVLADASAISTIILSYLTEISPQL